VQRRNFAILLLLTAAKLCAQPAVDPAAILARAREAIGFTRADKQVIHLRTVAAAEQNYQSDRTYPPFFSAMQVKEEWFDPQTGADRLSTQTTFPGGGGPAQTTLTDAARAFGLVGSDWRPLPESALQSRWLNPWAVIRDWAAAGDASGGGFETYRDYARVVLERATPVGKQRLFLDPKSGFPVKLEFEEKHYLWGQQHIEYLYSNWTMGGGVLIAGSSFRLADGKVEISQTAGQVEVIARDAAPSMDLPQSPTTVADSLPLFLQPIDPEVKQIGPNIYLLSNPGYTEAVTRVGDEVILFDATQGGERARKDAAAIGRLFPGYKKVTLVVTDLAWPHVAGVRYWVANGATVIAHGAARDFLQSVVDRRWTLAPDLLESRRDKSKLNFVGIASAHSLVGGAVSLYPIDGIGSEVALMGYIPADRFLWASDYIQTVAKPSLYATEVWRAVQREQLHPERTAAEHLPITPWSKIDELQKRP
jgi:hypothetical protein